jgi:F0F1-type ATP synthase assembly protein I
MNLGPLMAKQPDQPNPWRMAHMGLEFAGAALVLGAIGYYVDYQAGTQPWGTAIGLTLGVVGGFYRFIREALAANKQDMRWYEQHHPRTEQPKPGEGQADDAAGESPTKPRPSDDASSDDKDSQP